MLTDKISSISAPLNSASTPLAASSSTYALSKTGLVLIPSSLPSYAPSTIVNSTPTTTGLQYVTSSLSTGAIGAIAGSIGAVFIFSIITAGFLYWYKLKTGSLNNPRLGAQAQEGEEEMRAVEQGTHQGERRNADQTGGLNDATW